MTNRHGVAVEFRDRLDQWHWDHEVTVRDISAAAVRLFMREFQEDCSVYLTARDDGVDVTVNALDYHLSIKVDLMALIRDFMARGWSDQEVETMRSVARQVVAIVDGQT